MESTSTIVIFNMSIALQLLTKKKANLVRIRFREDNKNVLPSSLKGIYPLCK